MTDLDIANCSFGHRYLPEYSANGCPWCRVLSIDDSVLKWKYNGPHKKDKIAVENKSSVFS